MRNDEAADNALVEAWPSTVAAQERLQMSLDAGLLQRLSTAATIKVDDLPRELRCEGFQAMVDHAHRASMKAVDRVLWPLLTQVLILERIATFQQREMAAKKLKGVERPPMSVVFNAIFETVSRVADPSSASAHFVAAHALNVLGPRICPAPAGCEGTMLMNSSTPGRVGQLGSLGVF